LISRKIVNAHTGCGAESAEMIGEQWIGRYRFVIVAFLPAGDEASL
jgi:hypothetical protein